MKDKPDPNKEKNIYLSQLNSFIKSIYVDKKYTTKQKAEEFQEIKRKSSIVNRKGSVKEESKGFEMDLNETRTAKEIVNNVNQSKVIVQENKFKQETKPEPKKQDDLLSFLVDSQPKTQVTQQKPTNNTQQKKTINLDELFSSFDQPVQTTPQNNWNNQQPQQKVNNSWDQPQQKVNNTSLYPSIQKSNNSWDSPDTTQKSFNSSWEQPTQKINSSPWDQPSQTTKQTEKVVQNSTWDQPQKPIVQNTQPKSTNPFDSFDFTVNNTVQKGTTNPFDSLETSFSNMSVKSNTFETKTQPTVQNTPPPPNQSVTPVQRPVIPKLPLQEEKKKVEPVKIEPKVELKKVEPVKEAPKKVEPVKEVPKKVETKTDFNSFETKKTTTVSNDNKKGIDGGLEKISKEDSNNFAWENHFFTDTKSIDQLRGEARKDPFESQFKDITPQKIQPFQSKTKWEK